MGTNGLPIWLTAGLMAVSLSWADETPKKPSPLETAWGISPLQPNLRHSLEGIGLKKTKNEKDGRTLEVRVWYEDYAINHGQEPSKALYCKLAHSLVFGRNRVRTNTGGFPLDHAFLQYPNANRVEFTFFKVIYDNKPVSPEKKPLRVSWKREEKVIPYLKVGVSKKEWEALKGFLKKRKNIPFEDFKSELCDPVLNFLPDIRADFAALQKPKGP